MCLSNRTEELIFHIKQQRENILYLLHIIFTIDRQAHGQTYTHIHKNTRCKQAGFRIVTNNKRDTLHVKSLPVCLANVSIWQ